MFEKIGQATDTFDGNNKACITDNGDFYMSRARRLCSLLFSYGYFFTFSTCSFWTTHGNGETDCVYMLHLIHIHNVTTSTGIIVCSKHVKINSIQIRMLQIWCLSIMPNNYDLFSLGLYWVSNITSDPSNFVLLTIAWNEGMNRNGVRDAVLGLVIVVRLQFSKANFDYAIYHKISAMVFSCSVYQSQKFPWALTAIWQSVCHLMQTTRQKIA